MNVVYIYIIWDTTFTKLWMEHNPLAKLALGPLATTDFNAACDWIDVRENDVVVCSFGWLSEELLENSVWMTRRKIIIGGSVGSGDGGREETSEKRREN